MTITISKQGSDDRIGMKVDASDAELVFDVIKGQQFDCAVEIEMRDDDNKLVTHEVVKPA